MTTWFYCFIHLISKFRVNFSVSHLKIFTSDKIHSISTLHYVKPSNEIYVCMCVWHFLFFTHTGRVRNCFVELGINCMFYIVVTVHKQSYVWSVRKFMHIPDAPVLYPILHSHCSVHIPQKESYLIFVYVRGVIKAMTKITHQTHCAYPEYV